MEISRTLAWSFVNNEPHPKLDEKERKIEGAMPVISKLFPGINYFSLTGFYQVSRDYAGPVLAKLFPDLRGLPHREVDQDERVEISSFLPSKGYQHKDDPRWKERLDELLEA